MLSDTEIERAIQAGYLRVSPFDGNLLQPTSLDVRLGPDLLVPFGGARVDPMHAREVAIDLGAKASPRMLREAAEDYLLLPGEFVLGETFETVALRCEPGERGLWARIEGRSSLGRLGLAMHVTAGFVDPGWSGRLTLELANVGPWPIVLRAGVRVCQLSFGWTEGVVRRPYGSPGLGSHYAGAPGVGASRWEG